MKTFQVTDDLVDEIQKWIDLRENQKIKRKLQGAHYADIAEIIERLPKGQAIYLFKLIETKKTAEALAEIDEDTRLEIVEKLTAEEIAKEVGELDTDDAADVIGELPEERQMRVMAQIEDGKHQEDIKELLRYDDDTAGAIMAKELIKVPLDTPITNCLSEMRSMAENIKRVHSIYVVNKKEELLGRLSLKDLITAKEDATVKDIYIPKVDYIEHNRPIEEAVRMMRKYDLEALPVVDENRRLLGRITIDDAVDVIAEAAEEDYLLGAGVSTPVEIHDSVFELTKARLPWLFLGLLGGLGTVFILQGFEAMMEKKSLRALFFYTPLICAMAGNVGVQSSAIIVQGIANNIIRDSILKLLLKEFGLNLINGIVLGGLIIFFGLILNQELIFSLTISFSLIVVIAVAGIIGTIVPLILNKSGQDPALATGPFITTSNDIFSILLFFYIAKFVLGF
ncbi:MAG: magnesium transporter [Flavobacteriaceae bacterium]|nr:magnesium transporter [Flavobacteriaceae bacterium]MCY4267485.1 magnesium transporter [Flavobacteriaceae bacterium]MCY4298291.1 magnesium transporter [Flavobacteriaceae bacterium]